MQLKTILAAVPICAGLMFAQTTGTDPQTPGTDKNDLNRSTQGQSLSGILVASGCNSSSMNGAWSDKGERSSNLKNKNGAGVGDLNRGTDTAEKRSTGDANTELNRTTAANQTGVDQSGSMPRGTQPADLNRNTAGERSVTNPQTGMADRDRGGDTSATSKSGEVRTADSAKGRQWESGASNTGSWDKGCFISPTTTSFVFLTKDGKQLKLDDASNSIVSQKLSSANRVSEKSKIFRVRINGDMSGDTVHITDIRM
jgi:hypothetical protein